MTSETQPPIVVVSSGVIGHEARRRRRQVAPLDTGGPRKVALFGGMTSIAVTGSAPSSRPAVRTRIPGWPVDPGRPLRLRPRDVPRLVPGSLRRLAASRPARFRALEQRGPAPGRPARGGTQAPPSKVGAGRLLTGTGCRPLHADEGPGPGAIRDREPEIATGAATGRPLADLVTRGDPAHRPVPVPDRPILSPEGPTP